MRGVSPGYRYAHPGYYLCRNCSPMREADIRGAKKENPAGGKRGSPQKAAGGKAAFIT